MYCVTFKLHDIKKLSSVFLEYTREVHLLVRICLAKQGLFSLIPEATVHMYKIGVLKNLAKFTEKNTCAGVSF